MLVDAAIAAYSMISVPLYDTLGPEAVTYVCGHAELTVVACSIDVLDTLLKCLPDCPTVKIVVCIIETTAYMPLESIGLLYSLASLCRKIASRSCVFW